MAGTMEPGAGARTASDEDQPLASVIQIGRHEDIASICGRIDAAPTYAVVISVPGGNRSLSREIGLRRVIRHAEESGRTIAFATTSSALSSRARSLRIPVARKPEHVRWDAGGRVILRVAGRSIAVPAVGRLMQMAIIAAVALLVATAAFTIGPKATIVASPPAIAADRVITVTASPSIGEPDYALLRLPAEEVSSSRLVTVVVPTTGQAMVGTQPAQVTVTATNSTAAPVTIPAGSLLDTVTGLKFALNAEATMAPGETQYLAASAVEPGEAGNIGPDSITGFVDPALALIRAVNAGNAGGGLSEPRRAVAAEDVENLRDTAANLNSVDAVRRTIVADRPHDAILMDTAAAEVELGEPSPLPGAVADSVAMEVLVRVSALAITGAVLGELGRVVLEPPADGDELIEGSVVAVETGDRRAAEAGEVTTELRIGGQFATGVTRRGVEDAVSGKSVSEAKSILETRYGIQEAAVEVSPGWAPRLPRFGFRIDVEFRTTTGDDDSAPGGG